jgi:hypothetical protein
LASSSELASASLLLRDGFAQLLDAFVDAASRRLLGGFHRSRDLAVPEVGGEPEPDRLTLAVGKLGDRGPKLGVVLGLGGSRDVRQVVALGQWSPSRGAVVVDRLVPRDRHDPGAGVGSVERLVAPESSHEGLLKAVVCVARPDHRPQVREHRRAVLVEERLEGKPRHFTHLRILKRTRLIKREIRRHLRRQR